jgi:hypothetical protein
MLSLEPRAFVLRYSGLRPTTTRLWHNRHARHFDRNRAETNIPSRSARCFDLWSPSLCVFEHLDEPDFISNFQSSPWIYQYFRRSASLRADVCH